VCDLTEEICPTIAQPTTETEETDPKVAMPDTARSDPTLLLDSTLKVLPNAAPA
jgi:hypothetical protein